ncbi:MAG: hypothetical protein Q9183_004324 [Haloplaca sp. 2 TL-2023]
MAGSNARRATETLRLDQFELQAFRWNHVENMSLEQMALAFQFLFDQTARGIMTIDPTLRQWRGRADKWRKRWETDNKIKRGQQIETYPKHLKGQKLYYKNGHAQFDVLACMANCARCLSTAEVLHHPVVPSQVYETGLQPLSYEVSNPAILGNSQTLHPLQSQSLSGANPVRVSTPLARNPSAEHQCSFIPTSQSSLHGSPFNLSDYIPSGPSILERSNDNIPTFAYPQTLRTTRLLGENTTSEGYGPTPAANPSTVQYYEHSRSRNQAPETVDQRLNDMYLPGMAWPINNDPDFPSYS